MRMWACSCPVPWSCARRWAFVVHVASQNIRSPELWVCLFCENPQADGSCTVLLTQPANIFAHFDNMDDLAAQGAEMVQRVHSAIGQPA
eukprot:m.82213 g.82213  ORF g.82213 m.82213 type:complete len:89 (+) comp50772_c0_seq3:1110-1376(+)